MSKLLEAAKAVYHAYNRTDGRAPILSVHMPELLKAIEEAEATSARWSDEEIERLAKKRYPVSMFGNIIDDPIDMNRLKREQFVRDIQFARDHAPLSGEGEEKSREDLTQEFVNDYVEDGLALFGQGPRATPPTSQVDQGVTMSREPIAWMRYDGDIITVKELDVLDAETRSYMLKRWVTPLYRDPAPSTREKELEEVLRAIDKEPTVRMPQALLNRMRELLNTYSDGN